MKNEKFQVGRKYRGVTSKGVRANPMILVTDRYNDGLYTKINFTTNVMRIQDNLPRTILIDYDGNEFVVAYGIMFSATSTEEDCRKEQT